MARIRTIKPEFWTSEQVMECSMSARLLFIGLWNFCDDEGRHPLAPKQIKALIFPGDDLPVSDVSRMLVELSANGLIKTYVVEGRDYFYISGWRHQKIDRPQPAKYPAPLVDHSTNARDGREGKGEESNGEEDTLANASVARVSEAPSETIQEPVPEPGPNPVLATKRSKAGSRIPDDWSPTPADLEFAETILTKRQVFNEIEKFRDYWRARDGPHAVKRDWSATWRNWCRRASEMCGGGNGRRIQTGSSVIAAADRLLDQSVSFGPRPSSARPGKNVVGLLPDRGCRGPGDVRGCDSGGAVGISDGRGRIGNGPAHGPAEPIDLVADSRGGATGGGR